MSWNPNPTVTIGGVDFTGSTLKGLTIDYGRQSFWEQPRVSVCNITLANLNNSSWGLDINDSIVIKVQNSSGVDVTVFTGYVAEIDNLILASGSSATTVGQTIRGIGPFSKMARILIGDETWPKEFDTDRLTRIFNATSLPIDVIDSPGTYEFQSIAVPLGDAYTVAAEYAQQAFGYIYETRLGKIGFANEARRNLELIANGHLNIPKNTILASTINSNLSSTDITNDISLSWRAGTETYTVPASITAYGKQGASITTELHNQSDATFQVERYGALRAYPLANLSAFTVQLDASTMTNTLRDNLLSIYIGRAVQIDNLPNGISAGSFTGFVESHRFTINENQVALTIKASDEVYSLTPTRWKDVSATLIWNDVNALLQWQDYD